MTDRPRLYLIDGNSQMYRAYHAIRGLTGPDGRSTNAVYGFVAMLRKLISEQQPAWIAASFDLAGPTFRSGMAADYKANRAPMPADLVEQVPWVHAACEALGVPIVTMAGYEADDVLGTIAERAAAAGYRVALVTGDKDFFQLVRDDIEVFNPRDEGTWYDAAGVREKFGVLPGQVVDTLALMGDAIDNVKGVPGIGEKGARELIATWGSLDALLAHAGDVPQKKYREALLAHADLARQSRELLRIRTDVPVEFNLDGFRFTGPARQRCYDLFSQLGFRSLLADYAPTADTVSSDYAVVPSLDALAQLAGALEAAGRFAVHVVADGTAAMTAHPVGLVVAAAPHAARYVPLGHTALDDGPMFDRRAALAVLAPVFANPAIRKVGHDLKFAAIVLARAGLEIDGLEFDTMLASYLLDAGRAGHPLEEVALEHLGYKAVPEEEVRGRGARALPFGRIPVAGVLTFAGERADLALQLADRLAPVLVTEALDRVFRDLEMPLVPVLIDVERAGIRVDAAALAAQSAHIERELAERTARIVDLAGQEFNINSPKQLSEILFDKLGLPALKRTGKTRTASTSVDVLEELALIHDLPRQILEWRGLQKLKGTYIDALPQLVHPETGRVHTSFNQAVAATGRLSSSEPNLQNIPIRTELGREIRQAFVAEPGCLLISADYSQIELRVLAHLAEDETLIEAFRRGEDIHDRTARQVFGPSSGLDPHELRRRAKIINYALLYGKTAFTLARDIGVPPAAAQQFIDAYFAGFPRVRGFIDRTLADARASGYVKTMAGRRRAMPELNSHNGQIRAAAERAAVNLPIQGSAADILKRAMIDVHATLRRRPRRGAVPARMILTVHDELLFEVPRDEAEEVAALVRRDMEHAVQLAVPLTVDVGIGATWKEAKA
ncbi:MAG TPA: DNA polymerase I [Vicinamibacterales bacterium]|nr:DNA polymerase I [Vicinamibacterales bacterium]